MLGRLAGRAQRLRALEHRDLVARHRLGQQGLGDGGQPQRFASSGDLIEALLVVAKALGGSPDEEQVSRRQGGEALGARFHERDQVLSLRDGVLERIELSGVQRGVAQCAGALGVSRQSHAVVFRWEPGSGCDPGVGRSVGRVSLGCKQIPEGCTREKGPGADPSQTR